MSKSKKEETDMEFLIRYAKEKGYEIDWELTQEIYEANSDTSMTLRVPTEMKTKLKKIAKEKGIPYQRLVKKYILKGIQEDLAS